MENASKALLLAAAILIAIILISLGVYIVSQGQDTVQDSGKVLDEVRIQQFNGKFDIYQGTKTGSQVKQLVKTVSSNNIADPGQQVKFSDDSTAGLWTAKEEDEITTYTITNKIGNSKKYEVTMNTGKTGVIETITVTEK